MQKNLNGCWTSRTETQDVTTQRTTSLAQRLPLNASNDTFAVTCLYLNVCECKPHIRGESSQCGTTTTNPLSHPTTAENSMFLPQRRLVRFMMHLKLTLRLIYHFHAVAQGHKMEKASIHVLWSERTQRDPRGSSPPEGFLFQLCYFVKGHILYIYFRIFFHPVKKTHTTQRGEEKTQ